MDKLLDGQSRECLENKEWEESKGPSGSLYASKCEFSRSSVGLINEMMNIVQLLYSQCCGPAIHVSSLGLSFPHLCSALTIPEVSYSLTVKILNQFPANSFANVDRKWPIGRHQMSWNWLSCPMGFCLVWGSGIWSVVVLLMLLQSWQGKGCLCRELSSNLRSAT